MLLLPRGRSVALAASEGPSSSPEHPLHVALKDGSYIYIYIFLDIDIIYIYKFNISFSSCIFYYPALFAYYIYIYISYHIFAGLFYLIESSGLVVTAAAEDALPIFRESATEHRRLVVVSHTWAQRSIPNTIWDKDGNIEIWRFSMVLYDMWFKCGCMD